MIKGEGGVNTYVVYFPRILQLVICPVPGSPVIAHSAGRLRGHFMFRRFRSQIVVDQEGREPLPRCNMCGMHIPVGRLVKHLQTARYNRSAHMRWWIRDLEIAAKCAGATFSLTEYDRADFGGGGRLLQVFRAGTTSKG